MASELAQEFKEARRTAQMGVVDFAFSHARVAKHLASVEGNEELLATRPEFSAGDYELQEVMAHAFDTSLSQLIVDVVSAIRVSKRSPQENAVIAGHLRRMKRVITHANLGQVGNLLQYADNLHQKQNITNADFSNDIMTSSDVYEARSTGYDPRYFIGRHLDKQGSVIREAFADGKSSESLDRLSSVKRADIVSLNKLLRLAATLRNDFSVEAVGELCEFLGDQCTNVPNLLFTFFRVIIGFAMRVDKMNVRVSGAPTYHESAVFCEDLASLSEQYFIVRHARLPHLSDVCSGCVELAFVPPVFQGEAFYAIVGVLGAMSSLWMPYDWLEGIVNMVDEKHDAPVQFAFQITSRDSKVHEDLDEQSTMEMQFAGEVVQKAEAEYYDSMHMQDHEHHGHARDASADGYASYVNGPSMQAYMSLGSYLVYMAGRLQIEIRRELKRTQSTHVLITQQEDIVEQLMRIAHDEPEVVEGTDDQMTVKPDLNGVEGQQLAQVVTSIKNIGYTLSSMRIAWQLAVLALNFESIDIVAGPMEERDRIVSETGSTAYLWRVYGTVVNAFSVLTGSSLDMAEAGMLYWFKKCKSVIADGARNRSGHTLLPSMMEETLRYLHQKGHRADEKTMTIVQSMRDPMCMARYLAGHSAYWDFCFLPRIQSSVTHQFGDRVTEMMTGLRELTRRASELSHRKHTNRAQPLDDDEEAELAEHVGNVLPVKPYKTTRDDVVYGFDEIESDWTSQAVQFLHNARIVCEVLMGSPSQMTFLHQNVTQDMEAHMDLQFDVHTEGGDRAVISAKVKKENSRYTSVHVTPVFLQRTNRRLKVSFKDFEFDSDGAILPDVALTRVVYAYNALVSGVENLVRRYDLNSEGFPGTVYVVAQPSSNMHVLSAVLSGRGYTFQRESGTWYTDAHRVIILNNLFNVSPVRLSRRYLTSSDVARSVGRKHERREAAFSGSAPTTDMMGDMSYRARVENPVVTRDIAPGHTGAMVSSPDGRRVVDVMNIEFPDSFNTVVHTSLYSYPTEDTPAGERAPMSARAVHIRMDVSRLNDDSGKTLASVELNSAYDAESDAPVLEGGLQNKNMASKQDGKDVTESVLRAVDSMRSLFAIHSQVRIASGFETIKGIERFLGEHNWESLIDGEQGVIWSNSNEPDIDPAANAKVRRLAFHNDEDLGDTPEDTIRNAFNTGFRIGSLA